MQRYNPSEIEPKWQKVWADDGRYHASDASEKPKYYVTGMFPYPSGAGMHTGHFFEHSIVDGIARFRRALGYEVMYPMGWDSFGLPAENYAIKTGKAPAETTKENSANFKNQLTRVGASIDWTREIDTTDPAYYKWTQWIFTQLFERNLAYQKEANQWWCPVDKTVLANEQVEGGKCWRCGNEVVKKSMKQWFFKITDYADALLEETPSLDWPEKIKSAQVNWIGRSQGAEVVFGLDITAGDTMKFTPALTEMIKDGRKTTTIRLEPKSVSVGGYLDLLTRDDQTITPFGKAKITAEHRIKLGDIPNSLAGHDPYSSDDEKLQDYKGYYGDEVTLDTEFVVYDFEYIPDVVVFSTRVDTLFGTTFLVLAPEHPLARKLANDNTREAVNSYIDQALKKSEIERQSEGKEKSGVFTGSHAINPANGEKIPIWIADYVLGGYGTGAVMGVPAHDERDFAFAEKYHLPIIAVIEPTFGEPIIDEIKKESIIAVLRDPRNGKVLVLDWGERKENSGGTMFVGGGIEDGEDPVAAATREITEETGYVNFKHVSSAESWINNHFYSNVKETHVHARFLPILFELIDDTLVEQNLDDNENQFKLKWVDEDKLAEIISEPAHYRGYKNLISSRIFHDEGSLINSGTFDGMSSSDAREEIVAWLEQQGRGGSKVTYKMRDWLISRQRYWGAPIPIIHCDEHGAVAVPETDLPVLLPEVKDFAPRKDGSSEGKSVLAAQEDWVNTTCPTCGKPAKRETDTMDGYACSSWYLLRYTDPNDAAMAWDPVRAAHWMPLDTYVGGDHAVAHLLYVRFWSHVFYDMHLVPTKEPVKKLVYHGLIQAEDGRKMSKSLGNVVDPIDIIDAGYGADALRTFELFLGPIDENSSWNSKGIAGVYRFLNRLWTLVQEYQDAEKQSSQPNIPLQSLAHATIMKVTDDIYRLSFNTAIAAMMECVNELYKLKLEGFSPEWQDTLEALVKLMQPLAPHMAAELWQQLGHDTQLDFEPWPQWDDAKIVNDTLMIIVQVNGKLRAKLSVPTGTTEDEIKKIALSDENVQKFVTGEPKKLIYIPGKLVSIVA